MPLGHVPHQVAVHLGWAGHQQAAPGCGEGRLGILGAEPGDPDPGANTLDRYQTGASADPGIQHINVPDRCPRRVAMVTHLDIPAPPIVTTTDVAAPLCTPATPSWTCILAKPLPWPKGGRSSPLSVTGVERCGQGKCTRNDCERLGDTFGAFMKASSLSGYGHPPGLPPLSWLARLGCYAESHDSDAALG